MDNLSNISNISRLSRRNQICKGISLSSDIWLRIDKDKGDISRSRFIQRQIEKHILQKETIEMSNKNQVISSHDSSPPRHNISCEPSTHNKPLETDNHEHE